MIRRITFIGLGLLVVGAVGFGIFFFLNQQRMTVTQNNVFTQAADAFVAEITAGNADAAYNRLSTDRKANFSETYWKKEFFPQLGGYKGDIKRTKAQSLKASDAQQPPLYPPEFEPWQFVYEFQQNGLIYRLSFVMIRQGDQLRVHEIDGQYVPPAS